ncbi:MAG: S49 family peptidase [Verrucomicrobiota bacterium]
MEILSAKSEVPRETLEGWADDRAFLTAPEIEASGFAQTMDYGDFLEKMRDQIGPDSREPITFSQVDLRRYIGADKHGAPDPDSAQVDDAAVVFVEGVLVNRDGAAMADGERVARQIREVRKSGEHSALILRVNSPGGAVYPSRMIATELEKAAETMPVYISMGQYAASGGYWVSAGGDHIAANALTLTGSIGVFALLPNVEEAAGKLGLRFERSRSSEMANLFSASEAKSPKQMQAIEDMVARTYAAFLDLVARHRRLDPDEIAAAAGGQVWSGDEALQRGLVDSTAGFRALRDRLRDELGADHLQLSFKARQPRSVADTAFSWLESRHPFGLSLESGDALAELLKYRGPVSLSPVTVRD